MDRGFQVFNTARSVVVAADPLTAADLLPGLPRPLMHGVTTHYHVAPVAPVAWPIIVLDGESAGPVANSVVLTNAAPSYSPDSRALISTSVLGTGHLTDRELRHALERLHGVSTVDWEHLASVPVPYALPAAVVPLGNLRRPVSLGDGRFVAGDHRDTPSIQGAMVSGCRAARAVLASMAGRPEQ